jgi:hypothetical protein
VYELLRAALRTRDGAQLFAKLTRDSGLPGARMNLRLISTFAAAVGRVVTEPDPPVAALEELLDGWAALPESAAPGDRPEVVLPCAAVMAYGEVGAVRPDWWPDEMAKLRRAAVDPRWRVREVVAMALQRLLAADWDRTVAALLDWAAGEDPLVVGAAAAGVAEPPLLRTPQRAADSLAVQRQAVRTFAAIPPQQRRSESSRVLRQALGFTISVAVAATGEFALVNEMAASDDADLRWIARENLKRRRMQRLR